MTPPPSWIALPLALATLAAGCLGSGDAGRGAAAFTGPDSTDNATVRDAFENFTGTLTGTPAAPGVAEFPLQVTKGATEIAATLTWTTPVAAFRMELVNPRGDVEASGFPEASGRLSAATVDPPASGAWTIRVTATRAVGEAFTVESRVSFLVPLENRLADQVALGAGDFAELNLIMEGGAAFEWSFSSSNGDVNWDIHSHEGGTVIYHEEGTDASREGAFTAPKRQIYSILFESTAPTTITYEVVGAFRVHSHSQ